MGEDDKGAATLVGLRVNDRIDLRRVHATVLFVDVSGFTALVDSEQPETVYELMRPILDGLVLLIGKYGGIVQQVLGDGFMSVFGLGTPGAYDNDVERAVEAGIALARTDAALPVHVGLEAGDVLVSPSWEPALFAVWGRAVNVAKRLCDLAEPGAVYLGPRAFEEGGQRFLAGLDAGPVRSIDAHLKGIAGDVRAYRLVCRPTGAALCGARS
jgi:class 3 adenylate cyclase